MCFQPYKPKDDHCLSLVQTSRLSEKRSLSCGLSRKVHPGGPEDLMAGSPSAWLRLTFMSLLRAKEAVFEGHSQRNPPWFFQHLHTGFNSVTSHRRLNHALPMQGFGSREADGYLNVFTATLWHSGKIHLPQGLNCAIWGQSWKCWPLFFLRRSLCADLITGSAP